MGHGRNLSFPMPEEPGSARTVSSICWQNMSLSLERGCVQRETGTPHCLRHTAAMELLQAGVDRSVIALWLGHESIETTQLILMLTLLSKTGVGEDYTGQREKRRALSTRRRTAGVS